MKPKAVAPKEIEVPELKIARIRVPIIGLTPLLQHKFSEKAKQQMASKQQGQTQVKRAPKDVDDLFLRSMHWIGEPDLEHGRIGVPAVAFKGAIVDAAKLAEMFKTDLRRALFVEPDTPEGLVEIALGTRPRMQEDNVRIAHAQPDLRYRGAIDKWSAKLTITYNTRLVEIPTIHYLIDEAGFGGGVGEWRPGKSNGVNGRFAVDRSQKIEELPVQNRSAA